jgi:ABC-type multidrug transport system fused ATPase/permease subunit
MIFYFIVFFVILVFFAAFLSYCQYRITFLLYLLGVFQFFFVVYRLRLRVEIDAYSFLLVFFCLILFVLFVKFFIKFLLPYIVWRPKKQTSFFSLLGDIVFKDSYFILHKIFCKFPSYEKMIKFVFVESGLNFLFKFPFIFLFLFVFIPSFLLNVCLFLEVFLYNSLYFTLYVFAFTFFIRIFSDLTFFFSEYYLKKSLESFNDLFLEFSFIDRSFFNSYDLKSQSFLSFGDKAVAVESLYTKYQAWFRPYNNTKNVGNVIRASRSFFFNIFSLNVGICYFWSLFQWYEIPLFFEILYLFLVPLLFYFFSLFLSLSNDLLVDMFPTFYQGTARMDKKCYFAYIFIFVFLCLFGFILFRGLSPFFFCLLSVTFACIFYFYFLFIQEILWFMCTKIERILRLFFGESYQIALFRFSVYFLSTSLSNKAFRNCLGRFFCLLPFLLFFLFSAVELLFFSRFQYSSIFLFFSFFSSFLGLFITYVLKYQSEDQIIFFSNYLRENCNHAPEDLKIALAKPEDFIGHSTIIEEVWAFYLELRYNYRNNIFISVLSKGYLSYLVFSYRLGLLFYFIGMVSSVFLWLNLPLLLVSFYLLLFAFLDEILSKLFVSFYSTWYDANLRIYLRLFVDEENIWLREQVSRAEAVFAPIIKTRQEEENKQESSL